MIHYHGTPISGTGVEVMQFLKGRHALVSYYRPDDIEIVAAICASFILDNGAYSIWKKGGKLDFAGYLNFVEQWHRHPGFRWAVIPDAIGGTESDNDRFLDQWPQHLEGVPVFHLDESLTRLEKLASRYRRIALGASVQHPTPNTDGWWRRMEEIMNVLCDKDGRPVCKLHGLKMLNPDIFTRLPLESADSVNATRNSSSIKKKHRISASQAATLIAWGIEGYNSASVWERNKQINLNFFTNVQSNQDVLLAS